MVLRRAPISCAAAVVVACGAIAGCGGSGDSAQEPQDSPQPPPSVATLRPNCTGAGVMPGPVDLPVDVMRTFPGSVWIGPALFGVVGRADEEALLQPTDVRGGRAAKAWAGKFFLIVTGRRSPVIVRLDAEDGGRAGLLYDIRLNEKLSRRALAWRDLPHTVRAPLCTTPEGLVATGYPRGFVLERPGCVRITVQWGERRTSRRLPVGRQATCEGRQP